MGTVKYTGPVASFHCPTEAEIRSLKVHFSPKQLGEGTPSPENVREIEGWDGVKVTRCVKNLVPELTDEDFWSIKGWFDGSGKIYSNGAYRMFDYQSVSPNVNYIMSNDIQCWMGIGFYDASKNPLNFIQASRKILELTSPSNAVYIRCYFQYSGGLTPQLEISTAPTPYEPYHGSTTNYEFGVLGKNKFDPQDAINDGYATSASNYTITNDLIRYDVPLNYNSLAWCGSQYFDLIPNQTYTVTIIYVSEYQQRSNDYTQDILRIYCKKPDDSAVLIAAKTVSNRIDNTCSVTFTVPEYSTGIKINKILGYPITAGDYYEWKVQLELGSSATTYEPYNPNHTVYGGWVDLISGEVCEEYGFLTESSGGTLASVVDHNDGYYSIIFNFDTDKRPYSSRESLCNILNYNSTLTAQNNEYAFYYYLNQQAWKAECRIYSATPLTTVEEAKTYLNQLGFKLAYKIPTPITYHVAPTSMQTFLAQNNVWSNADYVEVEYDLHETQTILARKQFIVANQPHIEQASGAIASFTTDLAAPLKGCKIEFKPVQDLNGYSKPWPAGGGKNLFDASQIGTSTSAAFFTLQLIADTTYTFSSNKPSGAGGFSIQTTNTNLEAAGAVYDNHPITFTALNDASISIRYYNGSDTSLQNYWYQLEKGSAATSYEPYENICSISGWTGVEVSKTGKNILGGEAFADAVTNAISGATKDTVNKTITFKASSAGGKVIFESFKPNTQYTFIVPLTGDSVNRNMSVLYSNGTTGYLSREIWTSASDKSIAQLRGLYYTGTTVIPYEQMGVFEGEVTTNDFAAYTGTTFPIDWTTEAGTIYGGYVDLVKGELVQTWKRYDLKDLEPVTYGASSYDGAKGTNVMYFISSTGVGIGYGTELMAISDTLTCAGKNTSGYWIGTWSNPDNYIWKFCINANNQLHVVFDNATVGVTQDMSFAQKRTVFKNWLQDNPIVMIVPLQNPVTYSLTSTQLKTLRGTNNIWSSANGTIETKFWTH